MTSRDSFEYSPREEDLHLLPSRLFGYSLQDRRFVALDVRNLRRIEGSRDMFKNLIINPHREAILRALDESHFIRREINDTRGIATTNQDIVHNKGRGLVILLHGVPGVGKTSTAETIASHFQKPLLPITCGDLRLDPAAVEKSLKELFRVAQLWDCILLLDEADVFLSERVSSDLNRNALVPVFLRVLDYYSGILFLTTNRVGTIDEAFKSRIHISPYYPYLDLGQTEKIWEVNLDRLAAIEEEHDGGRKPLSIDCEGILAFVKKHFTKSENGKGRWNGRQIRNVFLIASALAHYERTRGIKNGGNHAISTAGISRVWLKLVVNASRAAAPESAQPAKPLAYSGWVNQYPSQPSFVPPQAQAAYNLATSPPPANRLYPQQLQQPHYVFPGPSLQNTYEQPLMAEGYHRPQALTSVPQVQPHEHGSDSESDM
ncbi:unnamed protein product [Aspergillus oryzae]|nr:unnamed protein product [Aspergillus oryzae]